MAKQDACINDLKNAESGWILLRIERPRKTSEQKSASEMMGANPQYSHLFAYAQHRSFAERFPRLTIFGIACVLLGVALIAEIDCLRGSGYFWR